MITKRVSTTNAYKKLYKYGKYIPFDGSFMAGGAIKDILEDKVPRDLDIYFINESDMNKGIEWYKWSADFEKKYENDNVVAFEEKSTGMVVELVTIVKSNYENIADSFDFDIDKVVLYRVDVEGYPTYSISYIDGFFESLSLKELVISGYIKNPIATFKRLIKYVGYGYSVNKESAQKLLDAIREVDEGRYNMLIDYVILGENDGYE